jgi:hypothetical protein
MTITFQYLGGCCLMRVQLYGVLVTTSYMAPKETVQLEQELRAAAKYLRDFRAKERRIHNRKNDQ